MEPCLTNDALVLELLDAGFFDSVELSFLFDGQINLGSPDGPSHWIRRQRVHRRVSCAGLVAVHPDWQGLLQGRQLALHGVLPAPREEGQ